MLVDYELDAWARNGGVSPFDEDLINAASIDLRIGHTYRVPTQKGWSKSFRITENGLTLEPNEFVLLHTHEVTTIPNNMVALIWLKSTTGRRGLEHLHAGYGDPGFKGQWTLEIINHWPWPQTIYAEERLIQLQLIKANTPKRTYGKRGHYQDQVGATPPWLWETR